MFKKFGLAFVSLLIVGSGVASASHSAQATTSAPSAAVFHASATPTPSKSDKKMTGGVTARKGMPSKAGSVSALTTCGATGGCFKYVVGSQQVVADGLYSNSYMANPFLKTTTPSDAHSLQELALQTQDQQQTIEVGWTRDTSVCGASTTSPCLFTFAWKNGAGYCYNGCGFVDYATNPLNVGALVPTADLGTVKQFSIQHSGTGSSGAWWVGYNTQWLGYWPDSLWLAAPAVTFTTGGFMQVFGEVAGKSTSNWPPCTDMGSGVMGSLGQSVTPKPSSWSATSYNGVATTSVDLTLADTYATGYTHAVAPTSPPGNTRSFSLGGPGANAAGTGVGTTGSC